MSANIAKIAKVTRIFFMLAKNTHDKYRKNTKCNKNPDLGTGQKVQGGTPKARLEIAWPTPQLKHGCLVSSKAIPFFLFVYRRIPFLILGRSVGLKKNQKESRNSRPWYPRTTLKVNIHILTKCKLYCEKCSCFCSCFSLCCYYAHFSD